MKRRPSSGDEFRKEGKVPVWGDSTKCTKKKNTGAGKKSLSHSGDSLRVRNGEPWNRIRKEGDTDKKKKKVPLARVKPRGKKITRGRNKKKGVNN